MKKMKIKEIKSKIKIVKEIKRESEGDKEIRELTSEEVPVSEFGMRASSHTGFHPILETGADSENMVARNAMRTRPNEIESEESGVRLYDSGKGMGGQASEYKYKLSDSTGSGSTFGRDIANGQMGGSYPNANRIEQGMGDDNEKKYANSMEGSGGKGKMKRYEWEV